MNDNFDALNEGEVELMNADACPPVLVHNGFTQIGLMKNMAYLLMLMAVCGLTALVQAAEESPPRGILKLFNGDSVPGVLRDSAAVDVIRWQGESFTRPFEFPTSAVESIQYRAQSPAAGPPGEFALELAGGDLLQGRLTEWTAETLTVETAHLGTLHLKRAAVRRLYRTTSNPSLVFSGMNGLRDWKFRSSHWKEDGPQIWTDQAEAFLTGDLDLPEQAVIEFEISWKGIPNFVMAFGVEPKMGPDTRLDGWRLETWNGRDAQIRQRGTVQVIERQDGAVMRGVIRGNVIVNGVAINGQGGRRRLDADPAGSGGTLAIVREQRDLADVAPVVTLSAETKRLHLTAYLDQTAGTMQVFHPNGTLAARISVPPLADSGDRRSQPNRGVRLMNRNGDLCLERLRITRWNGLLPTSGHDGTSRFELANGTVVSGEIVEFRNEGRTIVIQNGQGQQTFDTGELVAAELVPSPGSGTDPSEADTGGESHDVPMEESRSSPLAHPVTVMMQDGTRVSGRFLDFPEGAIRVASPDIQEPLTIPQVQLRALSQRMHDELPPVAQPGGQQGRLELGDHTLSGSLANGVVGDSESCLVWQPGASRTASPLKPGISGRIVYRERPAEPSVEQQAIQTPPAVGRNFAELFLKKAAQGTTTRSATGVTNTVSHVLHLRSGDAIPCRVVSIDDEGVRISSPVAEAELVPHARIKAMELTTRSNQPSLEAAKKDRLLTVPRLQKASPPTHLLHSKTGDLLRCRLVEMNSSTLRVELHLTEIEIPRDRVAQIIWFHPEEMTSEEETRPLGAKDAGLLAGPEQLAKLIQKNRQNFVQRMEAKSGSEGLVQVIRNDGNRVTFVAREVDDGVITGTSDVLGGCRFPLDGIDELIFGRQIEIAAQKLAYHQWRLRPAIEPQVAQDLEESGGGVGTASPLVGQPAPDFDLELLEGGRFRLSECKGQIVVLDFWATWCGPCMQTMPLMEAAMKEFDADRVRMVSVNLEEAPAQVRAVLERHNLDVTVAMDIDGVAARRYQANAIPQMVIVDREGTVARLYVGGGTNVVNQIKLTLTELLMSSE